MTSARMGNLVPEEDISPSCTMLPLADTFSTGEPRLVPALDSLLLLSPTLSHAPMGKVLLSLMMGLQRESMTAASSLSQFLSSRLLRRLHSATHFSGPVG